MEHVEGWIGVLAALKARRRRFQVVLLGVSKSEGIQEVEEEAVKVGVPVKRVTAEELDAMAHGRTHGGVIAVCSARPPSPPEELERLLSERKTSMCLLLLEGVEDARNLGFTLSSADALGVDAVLLKKHVWDFDPVDVSRASSGAWDSLSLFRVERAAEELDQMKKAGVTLWGCVPGARRPLWDAELGGRVCLAIGGEKRGLSAVVRERCDGFLTIPMRAGSTSLSLSHAATVVMAEAARQRQARAR